MKYVIYQLIDPDSLREWKERGYNSTVIYRSVLEKLNDPRVEEEHPTMEAALAEITNKKDELKQLTLTILPIITVGYDGEIK